MDLSLLKPLSEILIDTLDYSTNVIKKVKKNKVLIILLTIAFTIFLIVLLDTIQAIAFKNTNYNCPSE